jgi:hypothetical protein
MHVLKLRLVPCPQAFTCRWVYCRIHVTYWIGSRYIAALMAYPSCTSRVVEIESTGPGHRGDCGPRPMVAAMSARLIAARQRPAPFRLSRTADHQPEHWR